MIRRGVGNSHCCGGDVGGGPVGGGDIRPITTEHYLPIHRGSSNIEALPGGGVAYRSPGIMDMLET